MTKTVRLPFRNQGVLSSGLIITIGKTSPAKDLNKLESHKHLWKIKVVSRRNQREILYMLQHVFSYCFYFLSYVYLIVQMEMECNHARIIYGSHVHLIRMFHFKISTQLKGSNNNNKWKVSLYSLMNALPFLKEL